MLKKLHLWLFFLLSTVLLTGLNDFVANKLEIERALSVLILILTISLFFLELVINKNSFIISTLPGASKLYFHSILVFLILGSMIAGLNGNSADVFWGLRYYLPGLVVFTVFLHSIKSIIKEKGLLYMVKMIGYIINLNALLCIVEYATKGALGLAVTDGRYSGLTVNPNDAGFIFNISVIFGLMIWGRHRSGWNLVMIIVPLIAIILTFSKTAMISALIILLISLRAILGQRLRNAKLRYGSISLRFIYFMILFSIGFYTVNKFSKSFDTYQTRRIEQVSSVIRGTINYEVSSKRLELAQIAIDKLSNDWIFGSGIKTFSRMDEASLGVHNQFLLVLGESGLIPFFLFIYFNYKLFKHRISGVIINRTIRLSIISFCLYCLTCHNIFFSKSIMLIMALVINMTFLSPKKQRLGN